MNANEMKAELERQVDIVSGFASPAISDPQASTFINQALHSIMKRLIRQGVEYNEYNRQFIAPLKNSAVQTTSTQVSDGPIENLSRWQLEDDFYLMLNETAVSDKRDCIFGQIIDPDVLPVGEDYVKANVRNHQRKPFVNVNSCNGLVWRVSFGRKVDEQSQKFSELITDGTFNILEYSYRYLKKPRTVVVDLTNQNRIDTEIYEDFHDDIVNEAALYAIENLGIMSRFEAKALLNQKQGL
jgi:hypothetical protein